LAPVTSTHDIFEHYAAPFTKEHHSIQYDDHEILQHHTAPVHLTESAHHEAPQPSSGSEQKKQEQKPAEAQEVAKMLAYH